MFLLLGAPTALLMLDRAKGYPAPRFVRTQGLPALAAFVAFVLYALWIGDPIVDLVVWGAVAGILGTVALDVVRLGGVRLRMFPMDMPRMFGLMILGLAPAFQGNIMAAMIRRLAAEPEERRKSLLRERMAFLAQLSPWRRRIMMAGMVKGLRALPEATANQMRALQIEILTGLPESSRVALMRTMDELMLATPPKPAAFVEAVTSRVDRPNGPPPIPMRQFNEAADSVFRPTIAEARGSVASVLTVGYLYHLVNGMTFGIAYTMLFGRGSWALAFGWGILIWIVMMVSMPKMMPIIRFPRSFPVVPLLAHLAMAVPIGYVALNFVAAGSSGASAVSGLGLEGILRSLGLV